jgi:hypothetical protein
MDLNICYNEINHLCIKFDQKILEQAPLISVIMNLTFVIIDFTFVAMVNLAMSYHDLTVTTVS